MEQLLIDVNLPQDLNITGEKIPDILNKCLEIYHESLNLKNKECYSDSMYNMFLSLNILNFIKKNDLISSHEHLLPLFNKTCALISDNITELKKNVNNIYFNQVGHLITKEIRNKLDQLVINPLLFGNLYKSNFKGILFYGNDINNKQYIIQYIIDKVKNLNNTVIIHYNYKINLVNKINHQNIILLVDDLHNCDHTSILNLKKMNGQKINLYIISTTNNIDSLNSEQEQLFEYQIKIPYPNASDIENYLRYRIFQHLELENIFEKKFKISILEDINIKNISKKMYESKYDYHHINSIINSVLDISSKACIKQNMFNLVIPNKLLVSQSSFYSQKKKHQLTYLHTKPKYYQIIFNDVSYLNSNYCPEINFSSEDRLIKEIFIKESDITNTTKDIEILSLLNLEISNEELDTDFDCDYHISYIVLNLFIFYLTQIINNKNKINKDLAKSPHLVSFIQLLEREDFTIISINDFNNIEKKKLSIIFSCFNQLIFKEDPEFVMVFENCFINYHKTFFIDFKDINIELSIDYQDKLKKITLSKNIDISYEISKIIEELTETRIKTEIFKQEDKYQVNIESLDEKDISKLIIYEGENKLNSCPSIIIDTNIFDLECNYCITNEKDIDLLVEKFPQEYPHLYKEDEETWKYQPIKKEEHLNYLNSQYSHRTKFYLYIMNTLLIYQKKKTSMLNSSDIERVEALAFNLQMILDAIMDITQDFDKQIWQTAWNISSTENEPFENEDLDNNDDEQYEFNYNDNIIFLHKKFYIDIFFLKRLVNVLNIKKSNKLIHYYNSFNHKIYNNHYTEEILVRSKLNLKLNQDNIYTSLHIDKISRVSQKKELLANIIHKLLSKKCLYFDIFQNMIDITSKKDNTCQTYTINSDNYLVPLFTIAKNIIRNENNMSLFKLTDGILPRIITKWMTAYASSCICSNQSNYEYSRLFTSILLYDGYICNNQEDTIFEIINNEDYTENIINKINYIYKIKNVSYKKGKNKIFESKKSTIKFKFIDSKEFEKNNQEISSTLNVPVDDLNNLIKAYNVKKDYFDDCIFEKKINFKV